MFLLLPLQLPGGCAENHHDASGTRFIQMATTVCAGQGEQGNLQPTLPPPHRAELGRPPWSTTPEIAPREERGEKREHLQANCIRMLVKAVSP